MFAIIHFSTYIIIFVLYYYMYMFIYYAKQPPILLKDPFNNDVRLKCLERVNNY